MADKLEIVVDGAAKTVSAELFASVVRLTLRILKDIDKSENGPCPDEWNVIALSKRNPATMEIQRCSTKKRGSTGVAGRFLKGVRSLENGGLDERVFHGSTITNVVNLMEAIGGSGADVVYRSNGREVHATTAAQACALQMMGVVRSLTAEMSIDGRLEAIDVHYQEPQFMVFDPVTNKGTRCYFDADELPAALNLLCSRVRVVGDATFNKSGEIVSIRAAEFSKLPELGEGVSMSDLQEAGIKFCSGEESADIVARMRNGG